MSRPLRSTASTAPRWPWIAAALALAVVVTGTIRVATGIGDRPPRWDERYTRMPIDDLIRDGWSVRTALDFVETKGPAFVWPYAVMGRALGGSLGDLRLVSAIWLVLGVVPLLAIARRCGVRGPPLVAVTGLYLLLPQQLVLGNLVMSETIFVTGTLAVLWTALWGFAEIDDDRAACRRRVLAVVAFGALVAVLLHLRIHIVATAGAVCVVALLRHGRAAWPWWVAAFVAGLLRVPLWIRWGGLVSPEYQYMHQIGGDQSSGILGVLHPQNVAYLLAALSIWTALLAVAALRTRRCRVPLLVGGLGGLLLTLAFAPSMSAGIVLPPEVADFAPVGELSRYLGFAGTVARLAESTWAQTALLAMLAILGGAGLGALWIAPRRLRASGDDEPPSRNAERTLIALTFWTIAFGIALYSLTDSFVVDRYLLPWAAPLAILWWRRLPLPLLAAQVALLTLLGAGWIRTWLLR